MEKAKATFIEGNVYAFDGIREMARDFRYYCSINHRVKRVVYHATLSVPSSDKDKLNDNQWGKVGRRFLQKMNFCSDFEDMEVAQVPYIIVRHHDKDHDHIHIVAGRVRSDGTCVSDSWDYRRGEKAVRELEVEFGLSQPFKQTNRKSPHPYLVEKLERIYHNNDGSPIAKKEEQQTPQSTPSDPIANEVEKLLAYRQQLKKALSDEEDTQGKGDTEDKENSEVKGDSRISTNSEASDYSMSSLIARANKASKSPNYSKSPHTSLATPSPLSSNTPLSSNAQNNPNSPLSQAPQTPPELPTLINEVCQQVKTIPEFLKTLKDRGVEATVKLTRNLCVQGIVYHYSRQRISGTKLGAAYTFPGLRKRKKLRFERHHLPEIEEHNRSCQPLPPPPKWQWLQDVCHRLDQWLHKTQQQRYHFGHFDIRRDRDWLTISCHDSDFFVKARYDQKKRQWLPQQSWRFNQDDSQLISENLSGLTRTTEQNARHNQRRR